MQSSDAVLQSPRFRCSGELFSLGLDTEMRHKTGILTFAILQGTNLRQEFAIRPYASRQYSLNRHKEALKMVVGNK